MFYPDYFQAIAEPVYQVQQFRDRSVQTWQEMKPRLIDAGVMVLEVALLAMVATYDAGVTAGKLYRRLRFAVETGLLAWQHYREVEFEPIDFEQWPEKPEIEEQTLPNPQRVVELELLDTLIAACQGVDNEPEYKPSTNMAELLDNMDRCFEAMPDWIKAPVDNPALESPDQSEDQGFDPIPETPAAPLEVTTPLQSVEPVKRRPGRPKGSKNRAE